MPSRRLRLRGAQPAAKARTPIKHVIVIIGENRTFDHIFATYTPVNKNEKVLNLLSEEIVKANGKPGANYAKAKQYTANDTAAYQNAPTKAAAYPVLPPALTGGPSVPYVCQAPQISPVQTGTSCATNPTAKAIAAAVENGLPSDYTQYLLTGGVGQASGVPDTRVSYDGKDASHLPSGPYQLTNAKLSLRRLRGEPRPPLLPDVAAIGLLGQARQEESGLRLPERPVPLGRSHRQRRLQRRRAADPFTNATTGEGSTSMGFFNVQQGDAPYLKLLADTYSMSDNYHQAVNGGTGANHIMIGYADAMFFENSKGQPATPPSNIVNPRSPARRSTALPRSRRSKTPIRMPGTNNWYAQDGYGGGAGRDGDSGSPANVSPNASYGGGSYVNCADNTQPGIAPILDYLHALPSSVPSRCEQKHYYLVNNYNPGYFGDGSNAYTDQNAANTVFTIPPSTLKSIGDVMNAKQVSWAYFGDQFNRYINDKYQHNGTAASILQHMQLGAVFHLDHDRPEPARRASARTPPTFTPPSPDRRRLPAVSYVKPSGLVDGHPASSKLDLFEGFTKKIVDAVKANPALWADTAIFVTFDEGGGYYDSGYVQPVDFFGDGTRIPMIVVSKYSKGGHISHTYADHVSIAKFVEYNWSLGPITARSRDNLPNPETTDTNPYVPVNSPAIGDLVDLFQF